MSETIDRARAVAHYAAMVEEIKHPTTHRLTLEVFSLDPGTDLATCHFVRDARDGNEKRFVRQFVDGHARVVGLWRIVPGDS